MPGRVCVSGLPPEQLPWAAVDVHFRKAIKTLLDEDHELVMMEVNERTIVSRLACHVRDHLKPSGHPWHVDVEYNRILNHGVPKHQPAKYLKDAVEWLATARQDSEQDFGAYLRGFTASQIAVAVEKYSRETVANARRATTPDLIVHERTCSKLQHNLLAIEFKPQWSKSPYRSLLDLARMKAFVTNKLELVDDFPTYQYGLFLYFTRNNNVPSGWLFRHGENEPTSLTF
jgi:hypothetical protein